MNHRSSFTFVSLLKRVEFIQIPILQRDFAQGRDEAYEVRRQFLNSIKLALIAENLSQPLDLDFVYGNFEGTDNSVFSVLDGQQRLTTLFLLHWYLAMKESRLDSFDELFVAGSSVKFTYKTRVSAGEFFNALSTARDLSTQDGRVISDQIRDKQWFFMSWEFDPTVQACLTMLDAIHENFSGSDLSLYDRLLDEQNPRIIFQYLNLESFALSDELYIKMNARGKALTDFENFKAWLCGKLEKTNKGKEYEEKLDQAWTDLFWKLSNDLGRNFDDLYIRFFNIITFYCACERIESSFDYLELQNQTWLINIRNAEGYISPDDIEKFGSFDKDYLEFIESVLDYFSKKITNSDVLEVLKDGIVKNDYINMLKFYAYVRFIKSGKSIRESTEVSELKLSRWTRVTNNLINNHRIDEMSPFITSIKHIFDYSQYSDDIYELLASKGLESGFTKEQRVEESTKAKLILADDSWQQILIAYEQHSYLQGKIDLLLELSLDENDTYNQNKFVVFGKKLSVILSDQVLRNEDFLLQRALLTFGDYLVHVGRNKYSFCNHNRGTYRDRSENWLVVIKKQIFKELLLAIGDDVIVSLNQIIDNTNCDDWRKLVIDYPFVIQYCSNRLVFKKDNLIYLLSKSTLRAYHTELRTYSLYEVLKNMESNNKLPSEISSIRHEDVYGDDLAPYVQIYFYNTEEYRITYTTEGFDILSNGGDMAVNDSKLPLSVASLLMTIFPNEKIACAV
jgi:hypothetical protein